jgi:hypothetical protein
VSLCRPLHQGREQFAGPSKLLGGLDVRKPREERPSYDDDSIGRVDNLRGTEDGTFA